MTEKRKRYWRWSATFQEWLCMGEDSRDYLGCWTPEQWYEYMRHLIPMAVEHVGGR